MVYNTTNKSQIAIRTARPGEEQQVVEMMNATFETQESPQTLACAQGKNQVFLNDIFVVEYQGMIVALRCFISKMFCLPDHRLMAVTGMGGTLVLPALRNAGIYSRLHQATLEAVRQRGMPFAITTNETNSISYNHNKKTGFISVPRQPVYLKVLNYEKAFPSKFRRVTQARPRLAAALRQFPVQIFFTIGHARHPLEEVLGVVPLSGVERKHRIEIMLTMQSQSYLVKLLTAPKWLKIAYMARTLLAGKLKVRFSSVGAFMCAVIAIIGVLRHV